ncbi:YgaP-like transmembrane domain [uncultured Enterovirga sp.]|uniref:YgaP-like transmembrane domain n=1 Tax=uncultured Enterovirga sp. TaxID=2026352 RepID=UPI0035CB71D4
MSNAIVEEAQHLFSGETNLSMTERTLSVVGGLALAALAAKPRPNKILSLVVLLAGSALAIRGATGHCTAKAMIQGDDADGVAHPGA